MVIRNGHQLQRWDIIKKKIKNKEKYTVLNMNNTTLKNDVMIVG
jgi:hypothetical protein